MRAVFSENTACEGCLSKKSRPALNGPVTKDRMAGQEWNGCPWSQDLGVISQKKPKSHSKMRGVYRLMLRRLSLQRVSASTNAKMKGGVGQNVQVECVTGSPFVG